MREATNKTEQPTHFAEERFDSAAIREARWELELQ
jgi:hypothetical protein